jgi:hypothetical protein
MRLKEPFMKNILVIAGRPGKHFDPRNIQGAPEKPFEEWLDESFDFLLFHTDRDFEDWKEGLVDEDRYWAKLPLADRRKRAGRQI